MVLEREEAIEILENHPWKNEAMKMAIKALKQEPCEDAISRQAVQDYVAKYLSQYLYDDVREAVEVIDEYIGELPPVTPQPKTGHWIRWYEQKETDWYIENIPHCKCSECDKEYDPHLSKFIKYCNECGAKMPEPQESEETETWNGIHAQITAPKGTFERIFNDADDDNDI